MTFVFKSDPSRGQQWKRLFAEHAPRLDFHIWPDIGDPSRVRFLAAWQPPEDILALFPNLELIFSVGAGVDQFDFSKIPEDIALVRMVEPGIVDGMVEYVTHAVLTVHRNHIEYRNQQRTGVWKPHPVVAATRRRIGVMGLGMLGSQVLARLATFGFPCAGWSRSGLASHVTPSVSYYAGEPALPGFLAQCDVLICLLPLTDATRGVLNRDLFACLPSGASLINVGRGAHLVEQDLLDALEHGQLAHAILDVTRPEPLPAGHPFWTHERIVITPHIASSTCPETAVEVVLDNLKRHEQGRPMVGLVDRSRGY